MKQLGTLPWMLYWYMAAFNPSSPLAQFPTLTDVILKHGDGDKAFLILDPTDR